MKLTPCRIGLLLVALLAASAQAAPATITSAYTRSTKDCAPPPDADGNAEYLRCKPVGEWQAEIGWSAVTLSVNVLKTGATKRGEEPIQLGQRLGDKDDFAIEWRLANGKPFAVIFREQIVEEHPDWMKKKNVPQYRVAGERLRVHNLMARVPPIEIPAKAANANEEARKRADAWLTDTSRP